MRIPIVNQRTEYDCGVAVCTAIAEAYHSPFIDPQKELLYSLYKGLVQPTPEKGTSIVNMVEGLSQKRRSAYYVKYMSTDSLDLYIYNNIPVVLLIEGYGPTKEDENYSACKKGHYIIVFDKLGDSYVIMDPLYADYVLISKNNLLKRWHGLDDLGHEIESQAIILH